MTVAISNAFSVDVLPEDVEFVNVHFHPLSKVGAAEMLRDGFYSHIGHADIAMLVSEDLGIGEIATSQERLQLMHYDYLVVAQYKGPQLPEGATKLPEGAKFNYWLVRWL